jgi:ribosomal protein S14
MLNSNKINYHKDLIRRDFFNNFEFKIKIFKYFAYNLKNILLIQFFFYFKLLKLKKNIINNKTKIKNICIYSGRTSAIYSKLKISRIVFKEKMSFGLLSGIRKIS